jgi:hypothetical protein
VAIVESNVYGLWAAKQAAKGTGATAATKKLIQVGGGINPNRDDGSENWSDGCWRSGHRSAAGHAGLSPVAVLWL